MGLIRTPFSLETPSRMRNYRRFFTARARVAVYDVLRDKKRTLPAHTVLWPCVSLVYKIYISEFVGGEKKKQQQLCRVRTRGYCRERTSGRAGISLKEALMPFQRSFAL